jgi:hypothetical protein
MGGIIFFAAMPVIGQIQNLVSVEDVCREYPERVKRLFEKLDLEREDLKSVKESVDKSDLPEACRLLLEYYREKRTKNWLEKTRNLFEMPVSPDPSEIMNNEFRMNDLKAKVPLSKTGEWDWADQGPRNDREWAFSLNRHYHFYVLCKAWEKEKNPEYIRFIDRQVKDWVVTSPYPGKKTNMPQWRGLETAIRSVYWAYIFYHLQDQPEFTPAARILMLSAIPDHAHYNRNFHAAGGNWTVIEMHGLATTAAAWKEFKEAPAWFDYTMKTVAREMNIQVYLEGSQKELTSSYHRVVCFRLQEMMILAEIMGTRFPEEFKNAEERMWNYLAYTLRPSGFSPLNNDSDMTDNRPNLINSAPFYKRNDWLYIATNGDKGTKPEGLPSRFFPWSGHAIMRSGWDKNAQWAFFDIGPLGMGHYHFDKLHISISAYGRDILVDSGRYSYVADEYRHHVASSFGHNVIIMDGKTQGVYTKVAENPLDGNYIITPQYDYFRGEFSGPYTDLEGSAAHTRTVVYLKGKYWIVVDRIQSDRPRKIDVLWHFHPDCNVILEENDAVSVDEGKGNLRIVPDSSSVWEKKIVKGQTEPDNQGWYSERYNKLVPAPCPIYSGNVKEDTIFAWLLVPARGKVDSAILEMLPVEKEKPGNVKLRIKISGKENLVEIPLSGEPYLRGDLF